jgi:hypothetical protein
MVDGGILPVYGSVRLMLNYLKCHPEIHVISPEIASCYVTDESEATAFIPEYMQIEDDDVFLQSTLSSTAYALCRASAWVVRFNEDGPFGEPGWGCDDNDMAFRWNVAKIYHRDFTYEAVPLRLYRHSGGSHQRLFEETGIWPTQYGSVYEQRHVKCHQDYPQYHDPIWNKGVLPYISFCVRNTDMPDLAKKIKLIHEQNKDTPHEVIVYSEGLSKESLLWAEMFRYRWTWGNVTIAPDRTILERGKNFPEELWTGDFLMDTDPKSDKVEYV